MMNKREITIASLSTLIIWIACSTIIERVSVAHLGSIYSLVRGLQIASALFGVVYLAGVSVTSLFELIARRSDSGYLHQLISYANSVFIVPSIVLLIALVEGHIYPYIIYSVYGLLILLLPFLPDRHNRKKKYLSIRETLKHNPLPTVVVAIYLLVFITTIVRYPHLPAMDTYSWTIAYEEVSLTHQLDLSAGLPRVLFSVTTQILANTTKVSIFNLFKYVYPLMVWLMLPALFLIAQPLKNKLARLLVVLSPLASPVLIIELGTTRQQIMGLFYLVAMAALLMQARIKNDRWLILLTLLYGILGTFYHPVFILLVLPVMLVSLLTERQILRRHKIIAGIVILGALFIAQKINLVSMLQNVYLQAQQVVINLFNGQWNLTFPYSYRNSDGYEMGWSSLGGIAKYYGYYAGLLVLPLLFGMGGVMIVDGEFRKKIWHYIRQPAYLPLILIMFFFLGVAEIAPRFAAIAYLPDRAWQFIDIISPIFLAGSLMYAGQRWPKIRSLVYGGGYAAVVIGIVGALIVANSYAYTMPSYEWEAAKWIKANLPDKRIIFSSSSKNLLRYHAESTRLHIDQDIVTGDSPDDIIRLVVSRLYPPQPMAEDFRRQLELISYDLNQLHNTAVSTQNDNKLQDNSFLPSFSVKVETMEKEIQPRMQAIKRDLDKMDKEMATKKQGPLPNLYIYYSTTDNRNLYTERPYRSSFTGRRESASLPALDQHPELFSQVYNNDNLVRIWQVHLPPLSVE